MMPSRLASTSSADTSDRRLPSPAPAANSPLIAPITPARAAAGSIQLDAEALAVLDGVGTMPGTDTAHRHGAEPFLAESD
jgi:hypothetical protein